MIHRQPLPARGPRDYHVQVGHHTVHVAGQDRDDAIRLARRALCEEMPRMWDIIHQLDVDRFEVHELP